MSLSRRLLFWLSFLAPLLLQGCDSTPKRSMSRADKERMFELHRDSAFTHFRANQLDRAEDQIYRGLAIREDDAELRVLLGQVLERRGDRDSILKSELVWKSLLEDKDVRAPLGMAKTLERKGMLWDESARDIESGKRFTEAADPARRGAELRAEARGFWSTAQKHYAKALSTTPKERSVLSGLQRVTALLGEDEESLRWSEQALAACDEELARWRELLKRPELSVREEDRLRQNVRELEAIKVETLLHASSVATRKGDVERALAALRTVSELDPQLPEAHSRQAVLFERLGDHASAVHEIDEYLRLVDLPFDHPDVNAAYALRSRNEREIGGR